MKKNTLLLTTLLAFGTVLTSNAQSANSLKIENGLEVNSGSTANGSGLKFTQLNSASTPTVATPTKLLTLDANGNVVLGGVPATPAQVWTIDGTNSAQTTASAVVIGTGVAVPTGNPYGLYVGKGILAEKVRVAVNGTSFWADYVFDTKYKLASLKSVEKYIKENNHLPNVPSAQEVAEKGIDFAEMQATLLRKIEELTLYTIQQQKEIEKLKKEMKKLKK
jgi:hypothetical protein